MNPWLEIILLTTPAVVIFYWFSGAVTGFRLYEKLPEKVKRFLRRLYPIPWAMVGGGTAIAAIAFVHNGCSAAVHMKALEMRELPAKVYLKPEHGHDEKEAKLVAPRLPKEKPKPKNDADASGSLSLWMATTATMATTSTVTIINGQSMVCDAQGICVSGGAALSPADARFLAHLRSSYPSSQPPSKCVATCVNCHSQNIRRTWVTLVEERYCDGDHSDDDQMTLGWVKVGEVIEPTAWPAVNDTEWHSFDRGPHKLTEGGR